MHIKARHIIILLVLVSGLVNSIAKEYTAEYWQEKGDEFLQKESFDIALDCYNKSIQLDGTNASVWMKLGQVYSSLGRYPEAHSSYNESIRLDPDRAESWFSKGIALANL
ncbi:MAG: tetratricopeptide repeat protein, partial [Methanothrix sp.]|nr:tetratricopeptide repeat protein [Methanothrix sp.]